MGFLLRYFTTLSALLIKEQKTICTFISNLKTLIMKTFVKENWYKLIIGSSMFIFSVSALIYSVSPARAENVFKAKSNSAETPFFVVVNGVVYYTDGFSDEQSGFFKCTRQPGK